MAGPSARPFELGVILPEAEFEMGGATGRWSDYQAMARLAEDMGFDSVWLVDHLTLWNPTEDVEPQGCWECWTMLAALAAATKRVKIGSLVTPTSFRNPALLAKMVDTVDEISSGRVVLGLGAGYHDPEYLAFGYPIDHRVGRFEEAFTIIHGLLRNGVIDFEGRYYSARECELRPRGPRPNGPPIMIGAKGPRILRATLPYVDAWTTWLAGYRSHSEAIPPLRDRVDAACHEVGRDPATLERSVSIMVNQTVTRQTHVSNWHWEGAAVPLEGSTDEIAAGIRAFVDEGISQIQLHLMPNTVDGIERFGVVLDALKRP
jgi:alkanesulfonate monooxygenase SsuD/methylene tetrahydromethanopterin reductase-like flavin-dependent oxidoreductase (luciferase family)